MTTSNNPRKIRKSKVQHPTRRNVQIKKDGTYNGTYNIHSNKRKEYTPIKIDPINELESKFGEYQQIEDELKVLLDRKSVLRKFFSNEVASLEEEEGAGTKFFNKDESAAFYNAHTEIYEYPNEVKLQETAIEDAKKELKAMKELAKARRAVRLIKVTKVLKYWEPKR